MGQVGGNSSVEVGLQRVFTSMVIWFVSSLGTARVPVLLLSDSLLWTAVVLCWFQFTEWESEGRLTWNHLVRGGNLEYAQCRRSVSFQKRVIICFLKKSLCFIVYIDINIFLHVIQSRQIKTFYTELWLSDSTHKGKFWLGWGKQLYEFLKSFSLSQSDGLQFITDKCFLNGNYILYLKMCFGRKRGGGCSAKLLPLWNRSLRSDVFS